MEEQRHRGIQQCPPENVVYTPARKKTRDSKCLTDKNRFRYDQRTDSRAHGSERRETVLIEKNGLGEADQVEQTEEKYGRRQIFRISFATIAKTLLISVPL